MALKNTLLHREYDKFKEVDGETTVRVFVVNEGGGSGGTTLLTKAGVLNSIDFSGSPKTATVTFVTPFPSAIYSIDICGIDSRAWTYESKTAAGFTINSNAAIALTGEVSWKAIASGEST